MGVDLAVENPKTKDTGDPTCTLQNGQSQERFFHRRKHSDLESSTKVTKSQALPLTSRNSS